jgi:hypothetical protein
MDPPTPCETYYSNDGGFEKLAGLVELGYVARFGFGGYFKGLHTVYPVTGMS